MKDQSSHGVNQPLNPETWVKDHADYLFRYAIGRVRNREVAEDMVQETLLAAIKGKDQFKGEASERTWLVGILKHKMMDYFRKPSRELPVSGLVTSEDPPEEFFDLIGKWQVKPGSWGDSPMDALEKKEFWKTFEACLSALPGRLAQIFALREFEGLKSEEICNLLHVSTTNLNVMLFRSRIRLARCLGTNWFGKKAKGE
jgi:RNA polymerase sigma-70 factor (ECF subfamily)